MNDSGFSEGEGMFNQEDEDRFAIDAILSKEGVKNQLRSLSNRLSPGSTKIPAQALAEKLEETAQLSEQQIEETVPEKERALALFYKRTGGISIPSTSPYANKKVNVPGLRPPPPQKKPTAGGKPLYPIQLD